MPRLLPTPAEKSLKIVTQSYHTRYDANSSSGVTHSRKEPAEMPVAQASVAAEKLTTSHSEGLGLPEESAFLGFSEEKQIPRSPRRPRDDKINYSFRSLLCLRHPDAETF
jgi:hypothetical protein